MQKMSLQALAHSQLDLAAAAPSGRSAHTVYGGHEQVLRLLAGDDSWDGREGDLIVIPPVRHSLHATESAVVLLTVAKHD